MSARIAQRTRDDPHAVGIAKSRQVAITIDIPVDGLPQQLTGDVTAVVKSVQFVSSAAAGAAAASVGRIMATRIVVLCSSDESAAMASAGPLGLTAASDCDDRGAISIYRGTVLGGLVLSNR